MRRQPDVGLMLARRLRRQTNIKPTSGQHLVFICWYYPTHIISIQDNQCFCKVITMK